ncbi:Uncharacterised protein [Bordetella pertussis]|nr:Uncharacterised protein [Bordetella pertussis]CPM23555.1 Uncharacterised protein [Bordetella pertussis]CPO03106.1 Uncharacterised protein [Bordetella pertussis]
MKTPISKVTNISLGLFSARRWFTLVAMAPGSCSSSATLRIKVLTMAMNRAAGTPFPDTSPMAKHRRPSASTK